MEQKKKICIIGYPESTTNYQAALSLPEYDIILPLANTSIFDLNTSPFIFHALVDSCDMLILPGGGDIDPSFFHQNNTDSHNVDFILDNVQFSFLEAFVKMEKPVIGICKGMQLINVYFGGNLTQNLSSSSLSIHAYNEGDKYHSIMALNNPTEHFFHHWNFPEHLFVNSAHHQAISQIGHNLCPLYISTDHIIEMICHRTLPILGIQWHPERLFIDDTNQLTPLIKKLFKEKRRESY